MKHAQITKANVIWRDREGRKKQVKKERLHYHCIDANQNKSEEEQHGPDVWVGKSAQSFWVSDKCQRCPCKYIGPSVMSHQFDTTWTPV